MSKAFRIVKGILFIMVLVFLLASFSQRRIFDIPETRLAGVSEPQPDSLSWKSWISRDYQFSMEDCLDFHAGFRNSMVRLHNQIGYSVFHLSSNPTLTLGIDNFLFGDIYIEGYTGEDYSGGKAIAEKIQKLIRINSFLKSRGIDLLIIFAPNKARYYQEYIPEHKRKNFKGISNYEEYIRQLKTSSDIAVIDFNSSFLQMKDTASYPLFPKHGIHWTNFICQTYVADSLIRYISRLRNIREPENFMTGIHYPDTLLIPDYDLYELLNLFKTQSGEKIPYPVFRDAENLNVMPVNVLTIGDSFFWNIYSNFPWRYAFRENDFWFYGKTRYPKHKYSGILESDIGRIRQDLLTHDIVIVMVTEINLKEFLHFPEDAIVWLGLEDDHDLMAKKIRIQRVQFFMTLIRNNANWLEKVTKKATIKGVSLDEMIRRDAEYMVDKE